MEEGKIKGDIGISKIQWCIGQYIEIVCLLLPTPIPLFKYKHLKPEIGTGVFFR